jgi:XRE family transcriptional regulator, fatty acid utilization regulator
MLKEDNIRLIFGLKIKHYRNKRNITATQLADESGLSVSYLNEIEKGKKFPKAEKIGALSSALDVKYDELVSLKMPKELEALGMLIQSNIISELPLEILGIDGNGLIELLSNSPTKINAFLNTIVEIARNYDMQTENFYESVLRTYQEIKENYFDDIEKSVLQFLKDFEIEETFIWNEDNLKSFLANKYNYKFEDLQIEDEPLLKTVRSVFSPEKKILHINPELNHHQRLFVYGREIAFNYMKLENRPLVTTLMRTPSFELIFNNFQASYFATALLLHQNRMVKDMQELFSKPKWDVQYFTEMVEKCGVSAEMYMHRLTSILPKFFKLKSLFFLRLASSEHSNKYEITKELHMGRLHNPHASSKSLHYCRRWISIKVLKELEAQQKSGLTTDTLIGAQNSHYIGSDNSYFIISIARPMYPISGTNTSVSVGIHINDIFKRTVKFHTDKEIPDIDVNESCEVCPLKNCESRAAAPSVIEDKQKAKLLDSSIEKVLKIHQPVN